MKINDQKSVSKLTASFDQELKNLLMDEIKAIRAAKAKIVATIQTGLNQGGLNAA